MWVLTSDGDTVCPDNVSRYTDQILKQDVRCHPVVTEHLWLHETHQQWIIKLVSASLFVNVKTLLFSQLPPLTSLNKCGSGDMGLFRQKQPLPIVSFSVTLNVFCVAAKWRRDEGINSVEDEGHTTSSSALEVPKPISADKYRPTMIL